MFYLVSLNFMFLRCRRRTEPRPQPPIGDLHTKFCADWSSGSRDMLADRQTHRQTGWSQYSAPLPWRSKTVIQFQSRHNSHKGHCYVISFAAGKRLDVLITIVKNVEYSVSCPPFKQEMGGQNFFRSARKIDPPTFKTVAPPLNVVAIERPGWSIDEADRIW